MKLVRQSVRLMVGAVPFANAGGLRSPSKDFDGDFDRAVQLTRRSGLLVRMNCRWPIFRIAGY